LQKGFIKKRRRS